MDRAIYRSLNTEQRIAHLNSEMTAGKLLSAICKEIGIADNVTTAFRAKGWVRNEQGLFIKREPQHPGQMNIEQVAATTDAEEIAITEEGDIIPIAEIEAIEAEGLVESTSDKILPEVSYGVRTKVDRPVVASTMMQDATITKEGTLTPPVVNEPVETELVTPGHDIQKVKRVGRPSRTGKTPKKLTVEIDPDVYKALLFYKVDQELYMNSYIEELIKANVPAKYFEI